MLNNMLIAEIGSVHDGSFGNAWQLVKLAARCGANAVKFQTHIAEAETLADAPSPGYFKSESRIDYFQRTGFSKYQWQELADIARGLNVEFLSSPFSIEAVELLESIGMNIYKIPSGEITNIPMLKEIAELGKPIILSSGMSSWKELDAAVNACSKAKTLTVMQCSSIYPCPPEKVGLNVLSEIKERYGDGVGIGYSDHTMGYYAPIAAAALGASVIEKHFTFSREMYGSDAQHSMEPDEFLVLSQSLQDVWKMLACPIDKDNLDEYGDMKRIFQKSIVSARPLALGSMLKESDLAFKKPGDGIPAAKLNEIIGKKTKIEMNQNHKIRFEDLE